MAVSRPARQPNGLVLAACRRSLPPKNVLQAPPENYKQEPAARSRGGGKRQAVSDNSRFFKSLPASRLASVGWTCMGAARSFGIRLAIVSHAYGTLMRRPRRLRARTE